MKILVVGGGGREHALCWVASKSAEVFCAPGNPGTETIGTNLSIKDSDLDGILAAVDENKIDLTIMRPTTVYGDGEYDFLPTLVKNLKRGLFRMIGDGRHTVDLVHVRDVAEVVYLALQNDESIGQTYNIANFNNPSWIRLLKTVSGELGLPFRERYISYKLGFRMAVLMEFFSKFSGRPPRLSRHTVRMTGRQYRYSIKKAESELGYAPSIELLEGIRQCLKSFTS